MACNCLEDLSVIFEIAMKMGETLDLEREHRYFSEALIHRMGYDYVALWIKDGNQYKLEYANPFTKVAESTVDEGDKIIQHLKKKQSFKVDFGDAIFTDIVHERDIAGGSFGIFLLTRPDCFFKVYNSSGLSDRDVKQINTLVKKFQNVIRGCSYYNKALQEITLRKAAEQALRNNNSKLEKLLLENEMMLSKIRTLNKELEDKVRERTKELEETVVKLREIAIRDCMTGLYNRRHVLRLGEEAFWEAIIMNKDFSAIMLDLDSFKRVNDTYGHAVGDRVIEIIGKRLASSVKDTDLIGRYGGEEFVVFLPCHKGNAVRVAERIRDTVAADKFIIDPGISLSITVSLGVAAREEGESFDVLLTRADNRMYRAKRAGGNRIVS